MKILNALAKGVTDPVKLSNYFDEHARVSHKKEQAKEALIGPQEQIKYYVNHFTFIFRKLINSFDTL